ncbi:MAG: CHAT domain-containing protein [Nannocystaceae bacterium]
MAHINEGECASGESSLGGGDAPPPAPPQPVVVDVDLRDQSPKDKRKRTRKWTDITGITLHQTGIHGFGERAWKKVTAHLGVHSDGRVFLIHPLESYLWSSDALNRDTIAIEVAGNFLGDLSKPSSYWKQGGGPSELSEAMIDGLRRAIRYILQEVAAQGGTIAHVYAHRQAKRGKSNCPGAAIWQNAGVWAQVELGLTNGPTPDYTRKDGQPIPPAWDPRLLDEPLNFSDDAYSIEWDDMGAEIGDESPADDDLFFVDDGAEVSATAVRIRGVPRGLRIVDAEAPDDGVARRGGLGLSGAIDLDDGEEDPLAAILGDMGTSGMTMVGRVDAEADDGAGERTRGLGDGAIDLDGDALDFEIVVEEDEAAVVLLEEDGVFRWVLPEGAPEGDEAAPRLRGAGDGLARFHIPMRAAADAAPTGEQTRGLLSSIIKGQVTARIYKYFAAKIADLAAERAIDYLEKNTREGPVLIRGAEARDWIDVDDLRDVALPQGRAPRILLMIHGTFSSTRGSFAGLCDGTGPDMLLRALAAYDAVVGFDHKSLSRVPRDNAAAIRDVLLAMQWPAPPEIDVVCFSRGGLVARELVERLLPTSGFAGTIRKVIFVATTNAGTELARPENWRDLVDAYTTLACNAVRALGAVAGWITGVVGGELINSVGAFVTALADAAIKRRILPGLAAMDPSGDVVKTLNATPLPARAGPAPTYYRITSHFSADADIPAALRGGLAGAAKAYLADRITTRLYRGIHSDLVVHNPSTDTLHPDLRYSGDLHFDANAAVYHVNFFFQEPVHRQLISWLDLDAVAPATEADADVVVDLKITDELIDATLEALMFTARGDDDEDDLIDLHLRAAAPAQVAVGAAFRVDVELAREAFAAAAAAHEATAQALARGDELVEIEVLARRGARTVGHAPVELMPPARGATIGLFVDCVAEALGAAELWVVARQDGRPIARLALALEVVAADAAIDAAPALATAQASDPDPGGGAILEVIELRQAVGLRYRYQLRAPDLGISARFESPAIHGDVEDVVNGIYARIEADWKQSGGEPRRFDRRLRALGVQLGEQLLPRELRALLWEHRDALRADPRGLTLLSDEGHVPWELVHLKHPDKPLRPGDAGFLAELGLVRTIWGVVLAAQIELRDGRAFTVVPDYPAKALALPSAAHERAWMAEKLGAASLDPNPEALLERLEDPGSLDLLHVAAHGEIADREAWLILQGEVRSVGEGAAARRKWFPAKLAASEVAASGSLRGPGGERPLVFLNACKVARAEPLLSGYAGWAPAFLRAGAGAVVAPLWSVGDGAARRFAEGFYTALLAGKGFADAAVIGRHHARKLGDPTWLAYVVYAAPHGRLSRRTGTSA